MSCFFGCFRVKDSGTNLVTPSEPAVPRSKNALSSLFQYDEEELLRKGEERQNRLPGDIDVREFNENMFSKSYGTSLETPVKIRRTLEKWEDASAQNEGTQTLKFDSWFPDASMETQKLEKQPDGSPILVGTFLDSPSSCMTVQRSDNHNVVTPLVMHGSEFRHEQSKNEYVQFCHASDRSAISSISSEQSGSAGAHSVTKPSYPNTEELGVKELEDEDFAFSHRGESNEQKDEGELKPIPESDLSVREEMDDEGSLTSWFKPISSKKDGGNKKVSSSSSQNRKPAAERPILGMVAAHWNDDVTIDDPPKWWDGNGIPNSTNKYKEDQKVSWHATPFEERLEKALSEESLISQRKPNSSITPYEFNETEESDTAISHFQSSPHLKSVVSF